MAYQYSYKSNRKQELNKLRQGQDFTIWQKQGLNLQKEVSNLTKPIVEIGGPSDLGFYFLDGIELNSDPIITNISDDPLPYSPDAKELTTRVDKLMDARSMDYDNDSIGIFLMSYMSVTDDWHVRLEGEEREEHSKQIEKEFDISKLEADQVAIGTLAPEKAKFAQRVQIYLEVRRALCDGGLFFSDGTLAEVLILQRMGFELLAYNQESIRANEGWSGIYYEFVMRE
ncbi:MAG TPA: hypothetical protein VNX65_04850 [Patescibacteria group bacterium]|jgi:hypothetical protein|nr:hypothetical protein [Patescibacteria group bacterium]